MDSDNRVVVLVDMDCFYCQVEEKLNQELKGKPIAVVQYNPWKGGGIIAVNYVARAMGVTRHMRGDEAKEKCPELQLPSVPSKRGKADVTRYRDAGKEVAIVLQRFTSFLERASVDEAYLDITIPVQERMRLLKPEAVTEQMLPQTYALGYEKIYDFLKDVNGYGAIDSMEFDQEHVKRLLIGAVIVSEIRAAVYEETGYRCSAGIAHNKILAKLVCGMNKPNKQTILPKHSINVLYKTLSLKKVKHLGGKFGNTVCEVLKISTMEELQKFSEKELQTRFDEKNGTWLYNIARGTDLEPVQAKFNSKSIGCCKQFKGKTALLDLEILRKWLKDLGDEIEDRLEKDALENNRTPKQMVVSFSSQLSDGRDMSSSRSYNFVADDEICGELLSNKALELIMESIENTKVKDSECNRKLKAPIKFLGISVGKFEDNSSKKTKKIIDYFSAGPSKETTNKPDEPKEIDENNVLTDEKVSGKEYVINKYFQGTKTDIDKKESRNKESVTVNNFVLESSLDKQESFFVNFLKKSNESSKSDKSPHSSEAETTINKPINGEESNDTAYSGSTIDDEINKSIALFEDDPQDIERLNNIRQSMNRPKIINEEVDNNEDSLEDDTEALSSKMKTVNCPECKENIRINLFETHSDYHLALKLREEERRQVRIEVKEKSMSKDLKNHKEVKKKNDGASITSFFVKIDDSVPTEKCAECGGKVFLEKFSEHLDFHEAQKLSRILNEKQTLNVTSNFSKSNINRKRKGDSSLVKKGKIPCKSIDTFFK